MNDDIVKVETGFAALGNHDEMKRSLQDVSKKLSIIHDFIGSEFVDGKDFGKADDRSDKKVLLKPGAEKVCKLFNTRPEWSMDRDTWVMAGEEKGYICYLCKIVHNATGEVIGEGRGAADLGGSQNRKRDLNKTIKIAEKRALVDAALNVFNLSDKFTQDYVAKQNDLNAEKKELLDYVEELRRGIETELTNRQWLQFICREHLHVSSPQTLGAVRALKEAIENKQFDLSTGERQKKRE